MPSTTMPTADAPIASMGWRTVVSDGVYSAEVATSSKPITEHCSGTRTPAFVNARMAPKALMSSKASSAVNGRFCRIRFFGELVARLRNSTWDRAIPAGP